MANEKLVWDEVGERFYETGVDKVVLFPTNDNGAYSTGVAWNGVTAISENPSGAEATKLYADNDVYATLYSIEQFGATLEAYQSPVEFDECDGIAALVPGVHVSAQTRKPFGLAYRTRIANDVSGIDLGYTIHLIYGAKASPSSRSHATINESPEAETLSWEITTTPVAIEGMKSSAHIYIDSTDFTTDAKLKAFEDILYGVDAPDFSTTATYVVGSYVTNETQIYKCTTAVTEPGVFSEDNWTLVSNPGPRLPLPSELKEIFSVG